MGRPLNKRFFGTPTEAGNEIKVQFHNGTASVNGWIVKQLGSKKFRCSDGTVERDCFLVDKSAADGDTPAAVTAGEMTITVSDNDGVLKQVTKISGRKVTIDTGETVAWNMTAATAAGAVEMEEAGTNAAQAGADDFEVDAD